MLRLSEAVASAQESPRSNLRQRKAVGGIIARMDADVCQFHLAVCRRFTSAVEVAEGMWERPTPCSAWQARDVLEHVIGFHDVLLLRPLGLKPTRPRDDRQRRWQLTYTQLEAALNHPELFKQLNAAKLMPRLTQDVLVHTWDLARAVGADDTLDPRWCEYFLDSPPADIAALSASGMFAAPVVIDDLDPQARLLARLGRDPQWAEFPPRI